MLKKDVKVGETYRMKHTSGRILVKINREVTRSAYGNNSRERNHWIATNLKTGREIEIKSAVKLSPVVNRPVDGSDGPRSVSELFRL
jgi:hypothetical protein